MVGIRKAPILHHFSESIAGAATIRCFNQEDRFLMRSLGLVDDYSRIAFHNSGTMEWLCVRINFLFNFVFFLVLIILVTLPLAIDPSKLLYSLRKYSKSVFYDHIINQNLLYSKENLMIVLIVLFNLLRLGRTCSYLWFEPKCTAGLGDMEPMQC